MQLTAAASPLRLASSQHSYLISVHTFGHFSVSLRHQALLISQAQTMQGSRYNPRVLSLQLYTEVKPSVCLAATAPYFNAILCKQVLTHACM